MKIPFMRFGLTMSICFSLITGCVGLSEKIEKKPPPEQAPVEGKKPITEEGKPLYINTGALNLRACPGLNCKILTTLKHGEAVIKIGEEGEWLKVRVKTALIEGWVSSRFVSSSPPKPVTAPSPAEPSKPQEEWAAPEKGAKTPSSLPNEGFAK